MSTADAPKKPRETDDVPVPATLRTFFQKPCGAFNTHGFKRI